MPQITDAEQVKTYMGALAHPMRLEIEALRTIIKEASPRVAERVKWNAPSYYYHKDLAAFNLRQQKFVQLIFIFPNGLLEHDYGLLEGDWKDRREARFFSMCDVQAKKAGLQELINDWVALMDQSI